MFGSDEEDDEATINEVREIRPGVFTYTPTEDMLSEMYEIWKLYIKIPEKNI